MRLNTRQQLYKKYRLEGYTKYTAARKAGFSHSYAVQAKNIENRINMKYWLEKAGLTDDALADHARKGMKATKLQSCDIFVKDENGTMKINKNSNDFVEIPDWHARHKYFGTVLTLMDKVKSGNGNGDQLQLVNIKVSIDDNSKRENRRVQTAYATEGSVRGVKSV